MGDISLSRSFRLRQFCSLLVGLLRVVLGWAELTVVGCIVTNYFISKNAPFAEVVP
jgi:hypothetical protein